MKTILITGANRGIGFETARQFSKMGFRVFLGCRSLKDGKKAIDRLNGEGFGQVEAVEIDLTNQKTIEKARLEIGTKISSLDILINNAGITGGWPQATNVDISVFKEVYQTNFFGTILVCQSFMDLVRQSPEPRIVNVSTSLASMTLHNIAGWKYYQAKGAAYNSSKTALNMYTIHLAYDLRETPFKVNLVDPGYVATDFNDHAGTDSVEVAAQRIIKVALLGKEGPTGQFFSEDSSPENGICPW